MLRPERVDAISQWRRVPVAGGRGTAARRLSRLSHGALAILLWLSGTGWGFALGGKVALVRKYRPGQKMVYQTEIRAKSEIRSDPPVLKSYFPPVPLEYLMRQQNTVTVEAVRPDGGADIQHRFDKFEVQSDLAAEMPGDLKDSARDAQEDFGQRLKGQVLTVHYDRGGRLLGFDGAEGLLEQFDESLREPLRQMLQVFLEQMGGQSLYPKHRVKQGEEWTEKMDAPAQGDNPYNVQGESTLRYVGKTRYRGVNAAIVDFHFDNVMTPGLDNLRREGALAQLEAHGMGLDVRIQGHGEGRVLVALDDGRVLQNHTTMHQTMVALLKGGVAGSGSSGGQPARLEIQSVTEMNVEGSGK